MDIIAIVPPGSRVRYVENQYIDTPAIINANALQKVLSPTLGFDNPSFWGEPVRDAEKSDHLNPEDPTA